MRASCILGLELVGLMWQSPSCCRSQNLLPSLSRFLDVVQLEPIYARPDHVKPKTILISDPCKRTPQARVQMSFFISWCDIHISIPSEILSHGHF